MEFITRAIAIDAENADILELKAVIENEIAEIGNRPKDATDDAYFETMTKWMDDEGADYSKLDMRWYWEGYRGVHALTHIPKGETLLYVPLNNIITLEMARKTSIGQKMMKANLRLLSPKHGYLSTFLLLEKAKGEDSFWKPYIDVLPKFFSSFPIFFPEEDKAWLEGSPFLDQVHEKISDIKEDWDMIAEVAPEFTQFSVAEFSWARMCVCSRIFGMDIGTTKTDGFVPYADMLNHKRPRQTSWTYCNKRQGFIIEALEDIPRGVNIMDSYGKKCNSRFLLNYGFIVENNDANEYPFKMELDPDDPLFSVKYQLIQYCADYKSIRCMCDITNANLHQAFGFIRFLELKDASAIPNLLQKFTDESADKKFKPSAIQAIDIANEKDMLGHLRKLAVEGIGKYSTTLEDDYEILKRDDLSFNNRN